METVLKAAAAGFAAALAASMIRKSNPELAAALCMAGCVVALAIAVGAAERIADTARRARDMSGLPASALAPVLRCVGIGIIARLGSDACRDAGSASAASCVETAGAAAALLAALPLFETLLRLLEELA